MVVATQVLEHFEQLLNVCREVYRLLKPGGVFFITVPNCLSYRVLLNRDRHCYKNKTHVQFFSRYSLAELLSNAGFGKIIRINDFGGSNSKGILTLPQWILRLLGISTELRFVAYK